MHSFRTFSGYHEMMYMYGFSMYSKINATSKQLQSSFITSSSVVICYIFSLIEMLWKMILFVHLYVCTRHECPLHVLVANEKCINVEKRRKRNKKREKIHSLIFLSFILIHFVFSIFFPLPYIYVFFVWLTVQSSEWAPWVKSGKH